MKHILNINTTDINKDLNKIVIQFLTILTDAYNKNPDFPLDDMDKKNDLSEWGVFTVQEDDKDLTVSLKRDTLGDFELDVECYEEPAYCLQYTFNKESGPDLIKLLPAGLLAKFDEKFKVV